MTSKKLLPIPTLRAVSCAAVIASYALVACGTQDDGSSGGSSGTGGSSAVSGAGGSGVTPSAGTPAASGAAGSASMSGSSSGGASAGSSSGGMAGGGSGDALAGAGGSSSGGAAGAAGSGGAGGKVAAQPSAGCGKTNPQTGSGQGPLMVSGHQYYVKLPTNYDANKPYPTIIMFNPTNNPITWAEQSAGFEAAGPKENWIRVYPHPANSSAGWNGSDVSFFQPLYEQITANYCMDKARVFASGESSGGDFSSILGCEHADKLRAVAPCATKPVDGYPLDASTRKCAGQVTAVVIHGKNDSIVGPENGPKTRDFYVALNQCSSMNPMPVAGYSDTLSNCVMYQMCDANYPVYWCQHTDPNYSNTNHGWPAFAPKFLYSLFSSY